MQTPAANKAVTSSPKASPNRPYLPPLMSTLDAFVESNSDDRALDLLEAVKANGPNLGGTAGAGLGKKKTKKVKKVKKKLTSADTNQLPDPRGVPTSPRMVGGPLQNSLQPQQQQPQSYSPSGSPSRKRKGGNQNGSNSDNEDYGFAYSSSNNNSNIYESSQTTTPYHFPTTPIAGDRKVGPTPRSAPRSAPRAGRTYKDVGMSNDVSTN